MRVRYLRRMGQHPRGAIVDRTKSGADWLIAHGFAEPIDATEQSPSEHDSAPAADSEQAAGTAPAGAPAGDDKTAGDSAPKRRGRPRKDTGAR